MSLMEDIPINGFNTPNSEEKTVPTDLDQKNSLITNSETKNKPASLNDKTSEKHCKRSKGKLKMSDDSFSDDDMSSVASGDNDEVSSSAVEKHGSNLKSSNHDNDDEEEEQEEEATDDEEDVGNNYANDSEDNEEEENEQGNGSNEDNDDNNSDNEVSCKSTDINSDNEVSYKSTDINSDSDFSETNKSRLDVKNDTSDLENKPKIKENKDTDNDTPMSTIDIESEVKCKTDDALTSTTEHTLIVRSAKEVNNIVDSKLIKQDTGGLSVLRAEQLGATSNSENMLQNTNYNEQFQNQNEFIPIESLENGILCDVCNNRFPDGLVLEQHKTTAGHYKCHYSTDCASTIFQSNGELVRHQETVHGIPSVPPIITQLSQQVQSLTVPYQTPNIPNPLGQTFNMAPNTQPVLMQIGSHPMSNVNFNADQNFMQLQQNNMLPSKQNFNQMLSAQQPRMMRMGQANTVNSNYQQPRMPVKRSGPSPRNIAPQAKRRPDESDARIMGSQKNSDSNQSASDVINQLSKTITMMAARQTPSPKKPVDGNPVASILANRGITVTATNNASTARRNTQNGSQVISLNSAVSIIPANNKQNSVPNRATNRQTQISSRTPTVDLTGPDPPSARGRQLVSSRTRQQFICQVCDKVYQTQEQLNQHMTITHGRSARKSPHRCNQCTAQYATQIELVQHRNTFHKGSNNVSNATSDMMIPVVDLKQQGTISRLQSLGINHLIPLSGLGTQNSNGTFGIPIITASSNRNAHSLSALEATNVLPIGPLRPLR